MPEPSEDVTGQPLTGTAPHAARPARRFGLFVAVAVAVLLIDIVSKWLVVAHLRPGDSPRFLGGLFYFALVRNPGAAWGVASGQTVLFALVAVGVAIAIVRVAARLRSVPWAIALGLLLGGAVGNLIDRLFRSPGFLRGHVVDFISVFGPNGAHFPIFNLADSAITLGVLTLILVTLRGVGVDGRPLSDEPRRSGRRGRRRPDRSAG